MKIRILFKGEREFDEFEVDGWILDDPPGWYQLFQGERVAIDRMENVEAFDLPRLQRSEEDQDGQE